MKKNKFNIGDIVRFSYVKEHGDTIRRYNSLAMIGGFGNSENHYDLIKVTDRNLSVLHNVKDAGLNPMLRYDNTNDNYEYELLDIAFERLDNISDDENSLLVDVNLKKLADYILSPEYDGDLEFACTKFNFDLNHTLFYTVEDTDELLDIMNTLDLFYKIFGDDAYLEKKKEVMVLMANM